VRRYAYKIAITENGERKTLMLVSFAGNMCNFQVISQAQFEHDINEVLGPIEAADAQLRSGIIKREGVMEVVVALAQCTETHRRVLAGLDLVIIRPLAEHVGGAVYEPGIVQAGHVADNHCQKEGHRGGLAPEIDRHKHWQHHGKEHTKLLVSIMLKVNHRILHKVLNISGPGRGHIFRVRLDEQPSNMSKEEAAFAVMRVHISF